MALKATEIWSGLCTRIADLHNQNPAVAAAGHDLDHDLRVAELAVLVARNQEIGRLAAAAGFCHSLDRFVQAEQEGRRTHANEGEVELLVRIALLPEIGLTDEDRNEVVIAVLTHGRPNSDGDSDVTVTLKDADRIANCDPDVVCRSTRLHLDYPNVDYVHLLSDPEATYPEPRSIARDISHCLEWAENGPFGVRLPKAKVEIGWRADILRAWLSGIERSREPVAHYYAK